jgi:flagellar protein FliS
MYSQIVQQYTESEVFSAGPVRLVILLYRAAIEATSGARQALGSGDIALRNRLVNKALAIVQELVGSLNHQAGGEVSRNLAELYDYVQRLLLAGHTQQVDPPLSEAESILRDLLTAWEETDSSALAQPAASATIDRIA